MSGRRTAGGSAAESPAAGAYARADTHASEDGVEKGPTDMLDWMLRNDQ